VLVEQEPAAQCGKNRFEAEDNGGVGRRCLALGYDLQRIGDADREHAALEDGRGRIEHALRSYVFSEEGDTHAEQGAGEKLPGR